MSRKSKKSGNDAAAGDEAGANVGDEIAAAAAVSEHKLTLRKMQEMACAISPEELAKASGEHVAVLDAIERTKAEKSAAAQEFRETLADLNVDEKRLRTAVRSKTVQRMVECVCVYDYDAGKVITTRSDTGAVVSEREMTDEERQVPLVIPSEPQPVEVVYDEGPKLLALPSAVEVSGPQAGVSAAGATLIVQVDEETISQALAVLRDTKRASTSTLQRRMRVGFMAACDIMQALQDRGIVGPLPDDGMSPREILVDLDAPEFAAKAAGADEDSE